MANDSNISEIVSSGEAIKVIIDSVSNDISIADQYKLHAVFVLAGEIVSLAKDSY